MTLKRCTSCKTEKSLDGFHNDKRSAKRGGDGKMGICKECNCLKSRVYRSENQKLVDKEVKKWRRANPEKVRGYQRKYDEKNREILRAKSKEYYYDNLEKARASRRKSAKKWSSANPHKVNANNRNYAARKRGADGHHNAADIARIYRDQMGRCAICCCRLGENFHVDHIVALAAEGSNWPSNLQLLCPPCNHSKKDRDMTAVMQERGLLL